MKHNYEEIIDVITKDFTKKLNEQNLLIQKKAKIQSEFDTFSVNKEAAAYNDGNLVNNKRELDDDEVTSEFNIQIVHSESKINNFSNINVVGLNLRKYM